MAINIAEQTVVDSYKLVFTATSTSSAPTAFPFGVTSGDIDLLLPQWGGKGTETKAYRLGMLFTGDAAGSATVIITGACEGGPEEQIASINITMNAVVETGAWRIIDTMSLNGIAPIHLGACSLLIADSGNSRVAKLGFDALGYRYIRFYPTVLTGITNLRIYARHL